MVLRPLRPAPREFDASRGNAPHCSRLPGESPESENPNSSPGKTGTAAAAARERARDNRGSRTNGQIVCVRAQGTPALGSGIVCFQEPILYTIFLPP